MPEDASDDGEDRSVLEREPPTPDEQWVYGDRPDQVADLFRPVRVEHRAVVLVHGGFWRPAYDRTHLRPLAAALADAGHPVVLAEYAREPGDPDRSLADLRLLLDVVPTRLGRETVTLAGHSAGGHLALVLAANAPDAVHGVLALAPVADLVDADQWALDGGAVRDFLGGPAWLRSDLDPVRLPRPSVPVRLLHGMTDRLVPIRLSETYSARQKVPLAALAGTGHFELIDPLSPAWPTVLAELRSLEAARVLNGGRDRRHE